MSECTTGEARNPIDARLQSLLASTSRMSVLIVGALSVVVTELLAGALPFGNTARALALLPLALTVLYVLLVVAARFGPE